MSDDTAPTDRPDHLQVVTFDMQGETFAIEAGMVREIVDHMPETIVPGAPDMIPGLANFRGRIIPLADLHREFGFGPARETIDSRIIVITYEVNGETTLVGIKADKVHEVTVLDLATSEVPPRVGMRWRRDYIRCIAKRGGDFIIVPDLEKVLAAGRRADVAAEFCEH